nr:hypothetical protein [Tanacetum cinerariifolium]
MCLLLSLSNHHRTLPPRNLPQRHHHRDTTTSPPHRHHDMYTTTSTLPPRNPLNAVPHPTTTPASSESPPLNVTSIERPTTTNHGHQDKRPPKGSFKF